MRAPSPAPICAPCCALGGEGFGRATCMSLSCHAAGLAPQCAAFIPAWCLHPIISFPGVCNDHGMSMSPQGAGALCGMSAGGVPRCARLSESIEAAQAAAVGDGREAMTTRGRIFPGQRLPLNPRRNVFTSQFHHSIHHIIELERILAVLDAYLRALSSPPDAPSSTPRGDAPIVHSAAWLAPR